MLTKQGFIMQSYYDHVLVECLTCTTETYADFLLENFFNYFLQRRLISALQSCRGLVVSVFANETNEHTTETIRYQDNHCVL